MLGHFFPFCGIGRAACVTAAVTFGATLLAGNDGAHAQGAWSSALALSAPCSTTAISISPAVAGAGWMPTSSGPGGWICSVEESLAASRETLWVEAIGDFAPKASIITLVEQDGAFALRGHDSLESDMHAWEIPLTEVTILEAHIDSMPVALDSANDVPVLGTLTSHVGVMIAAIDLAALDGSQPFAAAELPAIIALLATHAVESNGANATVSGSSTAVLPLEVGHRLSESVAPHAALAAAVLETRSDAGSPQSYPAVNYPPPPTINCKHPQGGALACLCDCWTKWGFEAAQSDRRRGANIRGCIILTAVAGAVCGPVCIGTAPTGGALAAPCIWCLKTLGAGALGCWIGVLPAWGGEAWTNASERRDCIEGCQGLPPSWQHIQPINY